MSADELRRQIGTRGDQLWTPRLPANDAEGLIPLNEAAPLRWTLVGLPERKQEAGTSTPLFVVLFVILSPLALALDFINLLSRLVLYPTALLLWWLEKRWACWRGQYYFCPVCHQRTDEPHAYCDAPDCERRVQPRLRPHFNSLFLRTCSDCHATTWLVLGQRLLKAPRPVVCRHTAAQSGCYHPICIEALAGQMPATHLALAGWPVGTKHALMAHLLHHLGQRGVGGRSFQAGWEVSDLEMDLCAEALHRGYWEDTTRFEQPGKHYTLAWTHVQRADDGSRALVFHNVVNAWLERTDLLAERGPGWRTVSGLVLMLDLYGDGHQGTAKPLPADEVYTRLVRVVEEQLALAPGQALPFRVALLVPLPEATARSLPRDPYGNPDPEEVARLVREKAPALHALLERTAGSGRWAAFGGMLPRDLELGKTGWVRASLEWLV